MLNTTITTAAPMATRFRMPVLLGISATGASVEGRCTAAGTSHAYSVFVPAFQKDAFSGVRAWSPPVIQ